MIKIFSSSWTTLSLCLLLICCYKHSVGADYSYIEIIEPSNIAGKYGCMPTLFGSPTPLAQHIIGNIVISSRGTLASVTEKQGREGCYSSHVGVSGLNSNSVLLVDQSNEYGCLTYNQAKVAEELGVSGILIASIQYNRFPPTTGYHVLSETLSLPSCTISKVTADLIRQHSTSSNSNIKIDWSGYIGWSNEKEPVPPHQETPIEITSPWDLKWTYPAAMASFNPHSHPAVAGQLITPLFADECALYNQYTSSMSSCSACYALDNKFTNHNDLAGKILLFTQYPICFSNYHHYAYLGQQANAVGAVLKYPRGDNLPQSVGTFTVPYVLTVPLFVAKRSHALFWKELLLGTNKQTGLDIHMVLPEIKNRWGPGFTPHEEDMQSLPDTLLQASSPSSPSSESCTIEDITAGQATYNPTSTPEFSAPLKEVSVDPSCEALDDNAGNGRDCTVCIQKLQASTAILNGGELNGKMALLFTKKMYCAHEFIDITKALQDVSAKGLILVNDREQTFTLVAGRGVDPTLRSSIGIPSYNVRESDGNNLKAKMASCATSGAVLEVVSPVLDSTGRAPPQIDHVRSQTYANMNGGNLGVTEVTLKRPGAEYTLEAGQAMFNPETSDMMSKKMVVALFSEFCSAEDSCHACHLLESPFYPGQYFSDRIVVMKLAKAQCIRPVYNYVVYAQERGAKGVLFVTDGNHTLTLGPAPPVEDLVLIPSFVVSNVAFEDAGGNAMAIDGDAVFPQLENFDAPENIVVPTQPISVNNAGSEWEMEQSSSKEPKKDNLGGVMAAAGIWVPILCILLLCVYCGGKRLRIIQKRNQLVSFGQMTHEMETQTFQGEESATFSSLFPERGGQLKTKLARERLQREGGTAGSGRRSRSSSKSASTGTHMEIEMNDNRKASYKKVVVGDNDVNSPSATMMSYIEEGGTGRHQLSLHVPSPRIAAPQMRQQRDNNNTRSNRRNSVGV